MKALKLIAALFCVGCLVASANVYGAGKMMAGTAKINVTPPDTRYPVHDSLYARSLILDVDGARIAFITYDSGLTSASLSETLKKKYNLQEIYFCQSHNHSGARGETAWTEERFTKIIDEASKNMFEARISGGHRSFPQLSFNRLIVRDDGHARES